MYYEYLLLLLLLLLVLSHTSATSNDNLVLEQKRLEELENRRKDNETVH